MARTFIFALSEISMKNLNYNVEFEVVRIQSPEQVGLDPLYHYSGVSLLRLNETNETL